MRSIVRIKAGNSEGALLLTEDHRIPVVLDNKTDVMTAGEVTQHFANGAKLFTYDGECMHKITDASKFEEEQAVVEVSFQEDAVALVWIRPRRPRRCASGN